MAPETAAVAESAERPVPLPRLLSDEAKAEITAHPEHSHVTLASQLHVGSFVVKQFRLELARQFLSKGAWQEETDGKIGARFGLKSVDIWKLRKAADLLRIRGGAARPEPSPAEYITLLGGVESVKEALQNGGKTITDLFREKGISGASLSRERMRQIVGTIGLTGDKSFRTPLWYANKLLGPGKTPVAAEIADAATLRAKLAEAGGCPALAARLGVDEYALRVFAKDIVVLNTEEDIRLLGGIRPELVSITCSYCNATFYKSKTVVEREKRKYPNKKLHFCNKSHQGFYLAQEHGFLSERRKQKA